MAEIAETPAIVLGANGAGSTSPEMEMKNGTPGLEVAPTTPATPADLSAVEAIAKKEGEDAGKKGAEDDGDGDGDGAGAPRMMAAKQMRMEAELRDLRAKLSAMVEKQVEWETREREFPEPYSMPDEHRFALQHRRYNNNPSDSDSDSDDYGRFDQRRKQMERMLVRELKVLKREKEMIRDIRSLRRDRDDLLEKERTWERERLEMERVQRQMEKEKLDKERDTSGTDAPKEGVDSEPVEDPSAPADHEEVEAVIPTPPKNAVPKLHYVEWTIFKAVRANAEQDSFAIDVLKGEPVVTFDYTSFWWKQKSKVRYGKDDEIAKSRGSTNPKKQPPIPGQPPLPERIRINSKHILKILEKIYGEALSSREHSLVMIRPFKFLVYYDDQIRQKFHKLRAKFGSQVDGADGDAVAAALVATDQNQTSRGDGAETANPDGLENSKRRPSMAVPEQQRQEDIAKDEDEQDEYTTSAIALQQLECLVEFMDTEIQQKLKYLASDSCQRVSFTDIWYLFKPGDEVIGQNRKQAYKVIGVTSVGHKVIPPWRNYDKSSDKSEETPVTLHCVYVDFDGKQLGPVSKTFQIARFDGEKAVTSLDVYPLRYAEASGNDKGAFRQKLITRGRMFLDVAGVKHMHYNGLTLDVRDEVDSQVVIDFEEAFTAKGNSDWRPTVEQLIGKTTAETADDELCAAECCRSENVHKDTDVETKRNRDYIASLIPENRNKDPSVAIYPRDLKDTKSLDNAVTEDELVIMSYRVFGFVLRSRKWAKLDLTYLSAISSGSETEVNGEGEDRSDGKEKKEGKKRETAFDQLVLPEGHKEIVLSLIAQHFRDKESVTADTEQVDIVRGKGKGLIILLHGAPGVGKTTTAEGVAELFQKPLFQITCGDLGTTASEVEVALETNFALANRWGCILLIDEADVFLTARSPQDFIRNGLVAVFLRVLEYYAGILFLTTNRIGDFDEAFASRVHISLHYPQLDLTSTLEIFKLNLRLIRERFEKKGRKISIDQSQILEFAKQYWTENEKMRWNGRQIRNGCQTALALAEFVAQGGDHERIVHAHAEVKLQVDQLETVSKAYLDFISYLKKLYGVDAERRAKAIGIRARETDTKKDENKGGKEDTPTKRSGGHASVSSLEVATTRPEPSPTVHPTYPHIAAAHPPPGGYPQPYYYPQQYGQPPNPAQPVPTGYPPQAADQVHNMPPSGQASWQSLNVSPWQGGQQPVTGQGQYGGFPTGAWTATQPGPPPGDQSRPGGYLPPTSKN